MPYFSLAGSYLKIPNPSRSGLILYLDTKGKTNLDTHKDVLLNMNKPTTATNLANYIYSPESGYTNFGVHFDGIDDYISGFTPTAFTEVSLEVVVKLTSNNKRQTILQIGAPYKWLLRYHEDSLQIVEDAQVLATASLPQELLTEPLHIAVLLTKENCIIKLNNAVILNTQLSIQNLGDVNDWLCIGSEFPNRAFMQGTLYSLRLYNKILTAQDITTNYLLEKERWDL